MLERTEALVTRAEAARAGRPAQGAAAPTEGRGTPAALRTAECDRDGASAALTYDAAIYDTANVVAAEARAAVARAERLRADAILHRDQARATMGAAVAARRWAQLNRQAASRGRA
jgi:hypothetical protein